MVSKIDCSCRHSLACLNDFCLSFFSQPWMHCSSGLVGEEIGSRIPIASWAPLAVDPGADPVPRLCVLVYRCLHSTATTYLADNASVEPPTSTVVTVYALGHVGRGTDEPFNTRRPCIPSGCVKSVKWLAFNSSVRAASSLSTFRNWILFSSWRVFSDIPRPVTHLF